MRPPHCQTTVAHHLSTLWHHEKWLLNDSLQKILMISLHSKAHNHCILLLWLKGSLIFFLMAFLQKVFLVLPVILVCPMQAQFYSALTVWTLSLSPSNGCALTSRGINSLSKHREGSAHPMMPGHLCVFLCSSDSLLIILIRLNSQYSVLVIINSALLYHVFYLVIAFIQWFVFPEQKDTTNHSFFLLLLLLLFVVF